MTDEEKKAYDNLLMLKYFTMEKEDKQAIDTILNLIEKQSKEIEELKAISEYREKIIKGLGLKTLPKTITGFKELLENNDKKWEDKIKAKIKEYEEKCKNCNFKGKICEDFTKNYNCVIAVCLNEFHSLLEKE